jgi:hypothetical protein
MGIDPNEAFPSKYLKAADLDRDITVTMSDVQMEELNDGGRKPILYFRGAKKGMVLNRTNWDTISAAYGDNTDTWPGNSIILYSTTVDFRGKRTAAVRVRVPPAEPPRAAPSTAPRPQATPAPLARPQPRYDERNPPPHDGSDMNDEIPF